MKLQTARLCEPLDALRLSIGAPLVEEAIRWDGLLPLPPPEGLTTNGMDVSLEEVEAAGDGTLVFRGHRVLVYIRDLFSRSKHSFMPKFHVADCSVLEKMRSAGRWKKYVVAQRDDGRFLVRIAGGEPELVRLAVCQTCLARLGWQGFDFHLTSGERVRRVKEFELRDFFEAYPRDQIARIPEDSADTAPVNVYPPDWSQISLRVRQRAGFQCEQCRLVLAAPHTRFLDVHHRNGLKHDGRDDNLQVLCIACHASQPMHGHMKSEARYREFLQACHSFAGNRASEATR